jgi:hypothetical protein
VNLKPKVAENAIACLAVQTDGCLAGGYDCLVDALAGACPDATADGDCRAASGVCTAEPGEPACHALLDGMTDAGRQGVMDCVNADCSFGLYSCVEGELFL